MSGFFVKKISRVVETETSSYGHHFGGPPLHSGVVFRGCKTPLHLLYNFNLHDPQVGIEIPGVNWLPLYYGFPYNATDIGYQVISDTEIKMWSQSCLESMDDFPYENFPKVFPKLPVALTPISYEEHKTLVFWIAAYEINRTEMVSEEDRVIIKSMNYPFTQVGGFHQLVQGEPYANCPNPECENHKYRSSLKVFAVIWNQPIQNSELTLWGEGSDDYQLIYQMCPLCFSIHVCNRCT